MTQTILVADEDDAARTFLADNLTADGFEVLVTKSRQGAIALLSHQPDLVVVDVNGETLRLLDAVRSGDGLAGRVDAGTPLIVTTSHADELHRIRVLEHGGDDVVVKPYSYPELRARVGAVLRRAERHRTAGVLRAGPLRIDTGARQVLAGDHEVELTAKEYDLLLALADDPSRVCTREELIRTVWGYTPTGLERTVDSHASRLRRKLRAACGMPLVINVRTVGYCLCRAPGIR